MHSKNNLLTEQDTSLEHLQVALKRVDILLQREVRRWQLAGQDQGDDFRGLYVSDAEVNALLARPFGMSWGQTITLPEKETDTFEAALSKADQLLEDLESEASEQEIKLRLEHLRTTFNLSSFEMDTLLICLAPALDLRYERLYGYLQDDVTRKRPTINLILNLLYPPGMDRLHALKHFEPGSPLLAKKILSLSDPYNQEQKQLLNRTFSIDFAIVHWLLGRYEAHPLLWKPEMLSHPQLDDSLLLLAGEKGVEAVEALEHEPIFVLQGADRLRQDATAKLLAARLGRPLLQLDFATINRDEMPLQRAVNLLLRDALLTEALLYIKSWDLCLANAAPDPEIFQLINEHPDPVIISGTQTWEARGIARERTIHWVTFPTPTYAVRVALWDHYLHTSINGKGVDTTALGSQFKLTSGQIRDAVTTAHDIATQEGIKTDLPHLLAAARRHSNHRLGDLARKIESRYGWSDIILPNDQLTILREIVATVRQRPTVLDTWGVGKKLASSRGVTVLFAGPPGTGKTMGAEILAGELGLDLYKIDLSTVVSKYIGETEKNLERIFAEAETSNAILFFDEADALFGKRSEVRDAHDRYANIEISYLLQRMEAYDGVTILATNLRANLDEAFTRRLQFAIDYPFPEVDDRHRIWETLFPPSVPCTQDLDFGLLAQRFRIAGGNIRNIIVSAAYLAAADGGQVTMEHILHGTRRELQKMGRLVSEEDMLLQTTAPSSEYE